MMLRQLICCPDLSELILLVSILGLTVIVSPTNVDHAMHVRDDLQVLCLDGGGMRYTRSCLIITIV